MREDHDGRNSPAVCQARMRVLHDLLALAARHATQLNAWERGFLASMAEIYARTGGRAEPSEKQAICLLRIEDKLGGLAAVYGRVPADVDTADGDTVCADRVA